MHFDLQLFSGEGELVEFHDVISVISLVIKSYDNNTDILLELSLYEGFYVRLGVSTVY